MRNQVLRKRENAKKNANSSFRHQHTLQTGDRSEGKLLVTETI